MASSEDIPLNTPGGSSFTQRLWSEEVAIARAQYGEPIAPREPAYVFSNGRRFDEPQRQG